MNSPHFDSVRTTRAATALLLAALLPGCAGWLRWPWGSTQRWPGPMESLTDPLPAGDIALVAPGPEEVLVLRHADPVKVRPAGLASGYPLTFYDKSVRVHSGSAVYSSPGGRIEVLWPNGNSVVLYDNGAGVIASPSRGESSFIFRGLDRAQIDFKVADQVELLGGARLSGASGPFMLHHVRPELLRVKNQSNAAGQIAFRDERIQLDPGQVVDLALLSAGGKPMQSDPGLQSVQGPGFAVRYSGAVEVEQGPAFVRLRGLGDHEIQALGVRVKMDRDEEAEFENLEGLQRP